MENLWNESEAKQFNTDLELRVYTSRLLGKDPSLVLHGGGNTSVKLKVKNILGEEEEILYVKGSGWDLATIEQAGFAPVRMDHLIALSKLKFLSDPAMVNELKTHMTEASAPVPSVEAILHAILPYKFVDHTHANSIVTVTNTPGGEERIRNIYGDLVVVVPYSMPGFDLARTAAEVYQKKSGPQTIGMVLMNHGIFSFGETARESYDRMIRLVGMAEDYIKEKGAWDLPEPSSTDMFSQEALSGVRSEIAELRKAISDAAGFPVIVASDRTSEAYQFIRRKDIASISQQGPATPDHVIRTKRLPMVGRDVKRYSEEYRVYFSKNEPKSKDRKTILDTAPRVVLDEKLGLLSVGRSAKDASIINDLYSHTMKIIQRSELLGGFRALPEGDIFDVEYWDLEQAKLRRSGNPPPFSGKIALVTGAASGIGRACVESLLLRGAAVVGIDINKDVIGLKKRADYLGIVCDVTDSRQISNVLEKCAERFGGLDALILNAGVFPGSSSISQMEEEGWKRVFSVNLDSNLNFMREAHSMLRLSPSGGSVTVIGSKNVPAPGPGAAAYSSSKAALVQLARIAALEWGKDGIRVNIIHPDAVFDTGIWTDAVISERAKRYGMSVEEYKTKNVLKTEITSKDVADLVAETCGSLFGKITGAQIPIDGGNERVI